MQVYEVKPHMVFLNYGTLYLPDIKSFMKPSGAVVRTSDCHAAGRDFDSC